ncbi:MAG: glycoside hydrolase family 13 protein [Candidatus Sericytochromatia bacterium]
MVKIRTALTAAVAGTIMLTGCGVNASSFGAQRLGGEASALKRGGFTPKWVKDAVFYQIFPERFMNGDKRNDPKDVKPWGTKPELYNYMGGDLAGVRKQIPYMKNLGVNAIYFNPVFHGDSNHKYNTIDYMTIDPAFGTNAEFKSMISELRRNGIKVILDGVFNHTGDKHIFFQDAVKNGPKSKYWNFYTFWGFPVVNDPKPNYNAWWDFGTLPQLRAADNPEVQEYLYEVTEYWTKQGIDGWRLDVPNEIANDDFWRTWRKKVRAVNPNAYIVGEIWTDGKHWLQGDMFDSVMNYLFLETMLDFFAHQKISVDEMDRRLSGLRAHYGQEVSEAMFNILGSHDVPRLMTEAGGNASRAKEAIFFQMVYPGTPVIYYGDELGMEGAKDPDNRRTMEWHKVPGNDMLAFYKKLIAVRKAHPALRGGDMRTLMRHNHHRLFAFVREDQGEKMIVALNSGAEARDVAFSVNGEFKDGTTLVDALSGKAFKVEGGQVVVKGLPSATGVILGLKR